MKTTAAVDTTTVTHYENFPVASLLLPRHLRYAVTILYHFARSADDIADEGPLDARQRLQQLDGYTRHLDAIGKQQLDPSAPPIFQELQKIIRVHELPLVLLHDLLDAFRQDVRQTRYQSKTELLDYCRRSANPVGRLMLRLFQQENPSQLAWSDAICSSLQLINHWQDLAIDLKKSPARIYLPQDDMQSYGVTESQLHSGCLDDSLRALLRHECQYARDLMQQGQPLVHSLSGRIALEVRLIIAGGLLILDKIAAVDYDVYQKRPVIRPADGPRLLWQALRL